MKKAKFSLAGVVVPDIDSAKGLNFQGSPSILVNRRDIFTGMEPRVSVTRAACLNLMGKGRG